MVEIVKEYRVGEKVVNSKELVTEIIVYRNHKDVDVRVEDGTILEHISYQRFLNGNYPKAGFQFVRWPYHFRTPSKLYKYIGKKKRTLDGYRTLLAVHEDGTVDYEDDDGSIHTNEKYFKFRKKNTLMFRYKQRDEVITRIQ